MKRSCDDGTFVPDRAANRESDRLRRAFKVKIKIILINHLQKFATNENQI